MMARFIVVIRYYRFFMGLVAAAAMSPAGWTVSEPVWVAKGPAGAIFNDLAVNPQTPATIYATTSGAGLLKSTDGGDSWNAANNGLGSLYLSALAINPQAPATLYTGTITSAYKSTNSGANWNPVFSGNIYALAVDPQSSATVYAGTFNSGVSKSTDGGAHWDPVNNGLTNTRVRTFAIDPQSPATIYAGTDGGGVFKTVDGGAHWGPVNEGLTSTDIVALAINPQVPATIYAGNDTDAAFRSTDGGGSWVKLGTGQLYGVRALAVDPQRPANVYLGFTGGVLRSTDGGDTWEQLQEGMSVTNVNALGVDPQETFTIYAGTSGSGAFKLLPPSTAQTEFGSISASSDWMNMTIYSSGRKLFISDLTATRILVYDAASLVLLGEIPIGSYLPDGAYELAVHEGTGTLYAGGLTDSFARVLAINAKTHAIGPVIDSAGPGLVVDQTRSRLYAIGRNSISSPLTVKAIDINTNGILGSLDVTALMGSGSTSFSYDQGFNPASQELLFCNLHYDKFVVVNGSTMTGEVVSAAGSRGWVGIWNSLENKITITKSNWGGYFIYDRDTGASTVTTCTNDGTQLFFSEAANRVHSGAEVNHDTTAIEGPTDACQNVDVGGTLTQAAFVKSRRSAYFVGTGRVKVLDENTLARAASFWTCGAQIYPAGDHQVIVDQARRRVFARSTWGDATGASSCITAIDDGRRDLDFAGSGQSEVTVWRPGNGIWYMLSSSSPGSYEAIQLGSPEDLPVPGDYDRDGETDVAVWRPSSGIWYVFPSGTPGALTAIQWGLQSDKPVPGDYDGDGRTDRAVWRPGTGEWFILPSGAAGAFTTTRWGLSGDIPVPGDYDGDGKTDIAVWRPGDGVWYILPSRSPAIFKSIRWGQAGDTPVPADYDGDGKVDIGVWRAGNGIWYALPSKAPGTYTGTQWGSPGDTPVAADYDGDGRWDLGVFRPSAATWYILPSAGSGTYKASKWGASSDMPISAFTAILRSTP